jgi:hypothetical protein
MRLFFIPGFGEDETIFDKLHPHLSGKKVFLNLWQLLPDKARPELTAALFAKEIVVRYAITKEDLIIGHSTGGWVALFIKQIVHCRVVQIASWTDPRKVVKAIPNRHLFYFLVKKGFIFNKVVLSWSLKKNYRNKPSAVPFTYAFTRLIKGNRDNVVNQLRLILNPAGSQIDEMPELVIHAKEDAIIRFPEGRVCEVPGDHFSLYTHPELVAGPICQFLKNLT